MITPYLPAPSQSGGQTRSFYLIKHLSKDNNLTLICFTRDEKGLSEIRPYCKKIVIVKRGGTWDIKKILRTGFSPYPFLVSNYLSSELQVKIKEEIDNGQYDLIHTECFYLMPNIPKTSIPIVLVDQTIEYAVYEHYTKTRTGLKSLLKPLMWIDVFKIKYWEHYYWKKTHTVVAVSDEDKKVITKDTGRKDVEIIPNGIDSKYTDAPMKIKKTSFPSLIYGVSNMKWMQNSECVELLLKHVWPEIKKQVKNCKLYIIGRYAPDKFGSYKSDDVIVTEAGLDGEKDDPISYYHRSWLLVAPILSGNGTRTKFFEAMATNLPIITTKQGMEGIEIVNKKHAYVVPFNQVASMSIKLLKNKKERNRIGKNAKDLVKNNYTWEMSAQKLNAVYNQI